MLHTFVATVLWASQFKVEQAIAFIVQCTTSQHAYTSRFKAFEREICRCQQSNDDRAVQVQGGREDSAQAIILENEVFGGNEQPLKRNFGLSRRELGLAFALTGLGVFAVDAGAFVSDETELYANNNPDSAYKNLSETSDLALAQDRSKNVSQKQSESAVSDEMKLSFTKEDFAKAPNGLGLELGEVAFRTNSRIFIKSIRPDSLAASIPEKLRPGLVLVEINGKSIERTNAKGAQIIFTEALEDLKQGKESSIGITLRDPAVFENSLNALGKEIDTVTTQVAPAGETTQRNKDGSIKMFEKQSYQDAQKITVAQLRPPTFPIGDGEGAQIDDLLEISYIGRVLETDQVFDGSTVSINGKGISGRAGDVSLFFVLGKQPFGQFPPGWDVGLKGMGIGERRRLIIPPVLAYGSKGLPRRGIPPDSTLQYDVTLISINGLAVPTR